MTEFTIQDFVEPYVITSNKKLEGKWLWTRSGMKVAIELAKNIFEQFPEDKRVGLTVVVLDVGMGHIPFYLRG